MVRVLDGEAFKPFPGNIFDFDFEEPEAFVLDSVLDFVFLAAFAAIGFLAVLVAILDSFVGWLVFLISMSLETANH